MEEKKYETLETMHGAYKTTLNKMHLSRKPWQPTDPKKILSFMPGTVIGFNVKVGDKVKKGDQLALFRAMKMDNKILSPMDGTIKAIHTEAGANIAKSVLMIELA